MKYWESFKRKIFLSEDELKDIDDTIDNMSDKEMEKLIKKGEESFDKNHWKYSLSWTIIYLGVWGLFIWKGLRNGETLNEIFSDETSLVLYIFGILLIGFVFFKVKGVDYEDGMG